MRTLNSPVKFMVYACLRAVRHPRAPISYYYCSSCKIRFPNSANECPECKKEIGNSPEHKQESPLPWWASIICILIGIGTWMASALLNIAPMGEAARILVYAPLGHLFGMSIRKE